MINSTLNYIETGNCWNIEGTEVFLHVPFLKNCSDGYLKRVFKTDFGLILNDEQISFLRGPKKSSIKIDKVNQEVQQQE